MKYLIWLMVLINIEGFGQKTSLNSKDFIELNQGIAPIKKNTKKLKVAFLGGSITYNKGWRTKTMAYLQEKYPKTTFKFIAAGIPSLGSLAHAFRIQKDVLSHGKIDILFYESAVNDKANFSDSLKQTKAVEGIVLHALKANPKCRIVFMAFADESKNDDFERGIEPKEVKIHRFVAQHYGMPFLNLAKETYTRIKNKEFEWKKDFVDLHPSEFGQELYFHTIKTMFEENQPTSKINNKPKPLNKNNYNHGEYWDIRHAKDLHGFEIVEDWTPKDKLETREGFVHIPVLVGEKVNDSFSLPFSGSLIGVAVISGKDAGIIEYSIDDGTKKSQNLFSPWSNSLHLPWYLILEDNLEKDNHQISIKIIENKTKEGGNACRIAYFLIND